MFELISADATEWLSLTTDHTFRRADFMLAELRQAGFNAATQHYIMKNATFDEIKVKV